MDTTTESTARVVAAAGQQATAAALTAQLAAAGRQRLMYAVPDACLQIGVSRSTLFQLIKEGRIHVTRLGRRTYIAHEDLVAFVEQLRAA